MALTKIPANMLSGVDLGNSVRVNLGSSNNLALFHTGGNGVIHNTTGELRIRANTLKLQDYTNEDLMIVATSDGSVDLYHNNQKKFETSATGASVTGNLAVSGNLTVSGTTTELDTTNLNVTDKNITLNYHASSDTSSNADGAGITIQDAVNASTDATLNWSAANDRFVMSHGLQVTSGKVGIGTASPSHGLTVSDIDGGDDANMRRITIKSETHGVNSGFKFDSESANGTARGGGYYFQPGDTDATTYLGLTASDAAYQMVVTRDGKVGIGTDSPGTKLDIVESIAGFATRITNNQDSSQGLQVRTSDNDTGLYILDLQTSTSATGTNYASQFVVEKGGNVGIGIDSPTHPLQISGGASDGRMSFTNNARGNGQADGMWVGVDNTQSFLLSRGAYPLTFYTNATERMRIDSSGNLLVGKTAANNTTAGTRIHPAGYASFTIANDYPIIANRLSSDGDIQRFRKDGADIGSIGVDGGSLVIGGGDVGIGFYQGADALVPINGGTRAVRDSAIDLGMSSAKYKDLYLSNTIGNGAGEEITFNNAQDYLSFDTLGSERMRINSSGNVGIGTDAPTDPLTIWNGTPGIAFKDTSSNGEAFWQLDGTQVKFVNKSSAGEMMFGTTNARKMSLTQYGALHIDTTAGYSNKSWVNENTAAAPLGGASASGNTYQKLRLWVDGDINLNQGRGLHFGDVTNAAPLCIREGQPSEHGTDRDKLEIWSRGQLTLTSERGRIATGDTSGAGTARSSAFYIKKKGQMGGTWEEVITTPNGGDQNTRVFEDWTGRWVMVGRFASDARASIQGTWSSVSGLSTAVAQGTTTAFSADWGDAYPSEVRIMGCTDVEDYMDTRTIDFIYGNRPSGVHSYTPRQWKHFFAGQNADGMTANAGGSPRFGFSVGYAYDGKGRWYNPNMHGMGMSDANTTNPRAAYTSATSNAFNWNTALDAKLLATHYRTFASQDSYQTTGFGSDDNVQGFYDSYPTEYTNMGGGTTGGGVHATLTSAVFILLKLHW